MGKSVLSLEYYEDLVLVVINDLIFLKSNLVCKVWIVFDFIFESCINSDV